jgi:xylan 1,4-beta-xylosidase
MTPAAPLPRPNHPPSRYGPAAAPTRTEITHHNPILPGFFPDPSIVRVGADYYLVNSTFHYFPAIVISHSRDLLNWQQIGHVFSDPVELDLRHFHDGCGIWAPDISYHDGEFFVFYCLVQLTRDRSTNVRGNYMVRSRSILGPWSQPVQLTAEGNDPSHFVDDDGTHYILYAAGLPVGHGTKIARLTDNCSALAEPPSWIKWGPERRAPEGPHLFKRNGYYYHTMASQGGYSPSHHQIIARSRNVYGPYEPSPHNPFIAQASSNAMTRNHGHAKVFSTASGDWWAVYLCQRPIDGYSVLGRETSIDRVHWLSDDWPVLNHGLGPTDPPQRGTPSPVDPAINLSAPTAPAIDPAPVFDDFNTPVLDLAWYTLRDPRPLAPTLGPIPSHLRLHSTRSSLGLPEPRSLLLRRETHHHFSAETKLLIPCPLHPGSLSHNQKPSRSSGNEPLHEGCAGLACYYDSASHLTLGVTAGIVPELILQQCRQGRLTTVLRTVCPPGSPLWLKVRVDRLRRTFSYSHDGNHWLSLATIADCSFLSDEGTPNWGFVGTMTGLFALAGPAATVPFHSDFDYFLIRTGQAVAADRPALRSPPHASVPAASPAGTPALPKC